MGTKFDGNAIITKFNELYFFENAKVGYNGFRGCTSLREISLPKNMTALPGGTSHFKDNRNLVVYFPDGYQFLLYSTFGQGCDNVHLILPSSLKEIAGASIYSGSNYVLVLKSPTPPANSQFEGAVKSVYVPDESVADYKTAWPSYASKILPLSEYDGSIISPVWQLATLD